ncbi:DUF1492 domain-containing protein [Fructilactobacillus cliffordii]|uniref:ArpU family phage packaging/lysis transcriptional regulator n=1 Tax=Fructilactobacillus cliffordii TaxID=2940299 RepID=UPI00209206CD|nr:ArpU family phage packaging/lysis transcriptional regulator [Fructilactobacillus cliffordii]USS86480.1 DUF1492 domain-containing protein [Fructilactobacillus cliffordii]
MALIPEIDREATIKKTKNFFKKVWPRIVLQSGLTAMSLRSPEITDMPTSAPTGNANEKLMVRMLERQDDVKNVIRCINSLEAKKKEIMRASYIDNIPNWKIAQQLGYSEPRYYQLKNEALVDFADASSVYGFKLLIEKS